MVGCKPWQTQIQTCGPKPTNCNSTHKTLHFLGKKTNGDITLKNEGGESLRSEAWVEEDMAIENGVCEKCFTRHE